MSATDTLDRILSDGATARTGAAAAAEALRASGLPSARDEDWRYANLRALDQVPSFIPAPAAEPALALPAPLPDFERLVYVNGAVHAPSSTAGALQLLRDAPAAAVDPTAVWNAPSLRLGLLNALFAADAPVLRITGERAIELLHVAGNAPGAAVYPRLHIELAAGSSLRLVERYLGGAERALVCASAQLRLERAAHLTHYRLQQCEPGTVFLDTLSATLAESAAYTVRSVAVGAATARTSAEVRLAGRAAALRWHGLAVGHATQVLDDLLRITHGAPATRTEEVFRGIAAERARVAFNGQVHIEAAAPDSQAQQSLRGLVDGAGAEVDLRPRLIIDTDAVRASHGATTGRLDETLLFYLLSRGLAPATARTLLKWAFLGDVLSQIELPALRRAAEQAAAGQLADVAGALSAGGLA